MEFKDYRWRIVKAHDHEHFESTAASTTVTTTTTTARDAAESGQERSGGGVEICASSGSCVR